MLSTQNILVALLAAIVLINLACAAAVAYRWWRSRPILSPRPIIEQKPSESALVTPELRAKRTELARQLADLGFKHVSLVFSGGGDSGQLDDIECYPDLELPGSLYAELERFGEAYLEITGINWFDGEGGGSRLDLDIENNSFEGEVWWNEVVPCTGFSESVELNLVDHANDNPDQEGHGGIAAGAGR